MGDFNLAIGATLRSEGSSLNNNPVTREYSKFGITVGFLKSVYTDLNPMQIREAIRNMSEPQATALYKAVIWDRQRLDQIESDNLAAKVFDICVSLGNKAAITLLQESANDCLVEQLNIDGKLGAASISAVNSIPEVVLYAAFVERVEARYRALAAANPKNAVFLAGWLARLRNEG